MCFYLGSILLLTCPHAEKVLDITCVDLVNEAGVHSQDGYCELRHGIGSARARELLRVRRHDCSEMLAIDSRSSLKNV